jgi:uncharacterized phage protein (TIGR01671 family)
MREILFRGKRLDNGEWVEGYYLKAASDFIAVDDGLVDGHWELHKIDPDTVGQFTCLVDKNGQRIFEGDIMRSDEYPYSSCDEKDNYYAEVCYFDNCPQFGIVTCKNPLSKVRGISDGIGEGFEDNEQGAVFEVIGNIHDNKELLAEPNT